MQVLALSNLAIPCVDRKFGQIESLFYFQTNCRAFDIQISFWKKRDTTASNHGETDLIAILQFAHYIVDFRYRNEMIHLRE